eukprot:g8199.t1
MVHGIVKRDDKKAPVRWEGIEGNRQLQVDGSASALEVFATWADPNEKVVAGEASPGGLDDAASSSGAGLYVDMGGDDSDDSLQPPRGGMERQMWTIRNRRT